MDKSDVNRRKILIASGIGLAIPLGGCLDKEDGFTLDNAAEDDTFERTVSIEHVEAAPEDSPLEFDASVTDETITEDRTATLEVSITNAGDSARTVQPAFYKGASSANGEAGILLYSVRAPDSPSADDGPECHDETSERLEWTTEELPQTSIEPEETATETLVVVDDPTVEGCVPPGTYRFEQKHDVGDEEAVTFTWSFTVSIN